ncbi:MAG: hypothetical protein CMP69_03835 [Flavobacteriales bacterium]|nr:hypothetical protein [Flavobacteriales bacterium]
MIKYTISYNKPHQHYIDFLLQAKTNGENKMHFQLAAWRPGRYELGNFSQNIQKWEANDENGKSLCFKKITKDLWEVETENSKEISIKYNFYANQLDAGSCYLDENQLYINPVHCIFYIVDKIDSKYKVTLNVPKNYIIASSLEKNGNVLHANDYDNLAESPIICSKDIQHEKYMVNNINFHLWFQGKCKPNWKKLKADFSKFTKSQIQHFQGFPVNEYHFLFQITPYKSYHGVEHTKNTVILLGPGNEIMTDRYEELLGVCSHELYHTWNIKAIRPVEMFPYDYTKENYFKTGFVAEGVTTYMGDLMLYNSKVFSWNEFIKTQNQNLERHLTNYGRRNLSVADSGFDSWLDGYKLGAPNRKTSIYPDAALCMFMLDLEILNNTNGNESLHSVMRELYHEYGLKCKGYSEKDFKNIVIKYGGKQIINIFKDHIYGTKDYIPTLRKKIDYIGLNLEDKKHPDLGAQYFGIITIEKNNKIVIKKIEPDSVADKNGISVDDEITKINNQNVTKSLSNYLQKTNKEVLFTIKTRFNQKNIKLKKGNFYNLLEFTKNPNANERQLKLRNCWAK